MSDSIATPPPALHAVIGAGGGIGRALVHELSGRGIPVRAITRTGTATGLPAGVEVVAADAADAAALRAALAGADTVHHAANVPYPRWVADLPGMTAAITEATSAVGARLVVADNLYAYGRTDGPMTETTPHRATDAKGQLRSRLSAELLAADAAGRLRVTIGQAPDYFGPAGANSAVGGQLFERAATGQTPRWLGRSDVPHSIVYLPDLAASLVTLALSDAAWGRTWHLPVTASPTGQELLARVEQHLGRPLKMSVMRRPMIRLLGLASPMLREIAPLMDQWERPFVSDASAFVATFGAPRMTSLDDAVAATLDWFRTQAARAA